MIWNTISVRDVLPAYARNHAAVRYWPPFESPNGAIDCSQFGRAAQIAFFKGKEYEVAMENPAWGPQQLMLLGVLDMFQDLGLS